MMKNIEWGFLGFSFKQPHTHTHTQTHTHLPPEAVINLLSIIWQLMVIREIVSLKNRGASISG